MTTFRFFLALTLFFASIATTFAQDFKAQYISLKKSEADSVALENHLKAWEKAKPNDAEMFVANFNFYLEKGFQSLLMLKENPGKGENLVVTDSASEKPVGYLTEQVHYKPADLEKAIAYLDRGITKNPDRLDMYFGKAYVFGELEDFKTQADVIAQVVKQSKTNNNNWLWTDNKPLPNGREVMMESIQGYVLGMYETGETGLPYMRQVAESVLLYYPDHVPSLSNKGITYLLDKDFAKALAAFKEAEKYDAKDFIILNNIAFSYENLQEYNQAIDYYKKVIKYGSKEAKQEAQASIAYLKKKQKQ